MKYRNSIPGKYEGFQEPLYSGKTVTSQYVEGFDGTKLAVDILRPTDESGKPVEEPLPAIVYFSRGGRYGQTPLGDDIMDYCIPYGYIGMIVEMRGCGVSYGTNNSFASIENRKDTTAVLDWLATKSYFNGKACTFGGSNKGLIQFATAVNKPSPSSVLKGITPVVSNADFYYQDYVNGVSAVPMKKVNRVSGSAVQNGMKTKEEFLADTKKIKPVDEDVNGDMAYEAYSKDQFGKNMPFMKSLLIHNMCRDDENPNLNGEKTNITIPPITNIDVFKQAGIKIHQFAGFLESGPFGQLMAAKEWGGSIIVGPWDHRESRTGTDAFPEGKYDFSAEHLKWFDYLLKGVDNGFGERPRFVYYTLNAPEGENWKVSDTWPVENAKPTRLYLSPDKAGSAGSVNDGSLTLDKPSHESTTSYKVDTSIRVFDDGNGHMMDRMHLWWDGDMNPGVDNKALTFTSKPLMGRYLNELTGCTTVDLWVTSDQKDADFICYLEEVLPNGESRYISNGCLRASHRTSEPRTAWNECGATYHPCLRADMEKCLSEGMNEPVHLQFHIEPTSYRFRKGSRVRFTVTCSDKDTFQHYMYDEDNLPTINLYQGGDHASFIEVPFVEDTENVYNGTLEKDGYTGPATLYFFKERTYLYFNGTWENYATQELSWDIVSKKAVFDQGFTFTWEGEAHNNGVLQDYRGGDRVIQPFPVKRRQVVDVVPVSSNDDRLYVPNYKTIYIEEYANDFKRNSGYRPVVVYMHGYSRTPSKLQPLQLKMLDEDYIVIGIDMRNYPPDPFPNYLHDEKGCVRYIRAHAEELGIDPQRIGACGQSLGGNGLLLLAVTGGCDEDLEGSVGGNLAFSSRLQAAVVGYGWSDLLTMGQDIIDQNSGMSDEVIRRKWENSNGPMAPAGAVIGFTGKNKGLQVLIDFEKALKAGDITTYDNAEELTLMLKKAKAASPINHIGPDTPPMALFSGLDDASIDIADRQSYRTFDRMSHYGVDCFLYTNTNGRYGKRPEIITGVIEFLNNYLKNGPCYKKAVLKPDSMSIVENQSAAELNYVPLKRMDGELFLSCAYLKQFFAADVKSDRVMDGMDYVKSENLRGSGVSLRFFADKDTAVLIPESEMPTMTARQRA